jgi:hypothetical protein
MTIVFVHSFYKPHYMNVIVLFNMNCFLQDSGKNVIPGQHGELLVMFDEGSMFSVSGYKGKPKHGYVCVQVSQASFYHNG